MDVLAQKDVLGLIENGRPPCVSIFMATHRTWTDSGQDPIRLKNLLGAAEERLFAGGLRRAEARELLAPARKLIDDASFWRGQAVGLALFGDLAGWRHFRLPEPFAERVEVGGRFCIKPLLPLLAGLTRFHVLALSQKRARLFACTAYEIAETDLGDAAQELEETFRHGDTDRELLQFHTTAVGRKAGSAVFHGQGGDMDLAHRKRVTAHRLGRLEDAVRARLGGGSEPLVLAGVENIRSLYGEVNAYPHLLEDGVGGNPDGLKPEQLHRAAWQAVRPVFDGKREEVASLYRQLSGTRMASRDLKDILPAASLGRVDSLFVIAGAEARGRFDPADMSVVEDGSPGSDDLLDLAAAHVFSHGGAVFAVPPERMPVPNGGATAAIFRY